MKGKMLSEKKQNKIDVHLQLWKLWSVSHELIKARFYQEKMGQQFRVPAFELS